MSIRYIILGYLNTSDLTGYELKKAIAAHPFLPWSGNNNQIYKALTELEDNGYIQSQRVIQSLAPNKKLNRRFVIMKISPMMVTLIDKMGSDLSVVNAARVSFAKESDWEAINPVEFGMAHLKREGSLNTYEQGEVCLSAKDQKLISYLAKHNHWTPFAHAFLSFRIKAPIFVARQLVKHQVGLAWNEVSRRYVDDEPEFWFPEVWRKRAENVKQGSSNVEIPPINLLVRDTNDEYTNSPENFVEEALNFYQGLLDAGVAPEQARMVLPQNTMTEWIWSGSLAAFARVCRLRLDPHAQQETREIAQQINDLVPSEFEHSWKALLN